MSISVKSKARIIASLTVGGFIAMIFLALGCEGKYGVIEEERVSLAPTQTVALDTASETVNVTPAVAISVESTPVMEDVEVIAVRPQVVDTTRKVTYKQAEAAFLDRNYSEAVELFTRYTQQKPKNAWGYYMLGLSAHRAGNLAQAATALEKSSSIDPQHIKSWVNLGRTYMAQQEPEKSLYAIEKVLAIDPSARDAYRIKGRALHQLGEVSKAEIAYRKALTTNREDAWAMNNLAYLLIGEQKFDDALPLMARAIELNDQVPVFHNNLGMALENKGFIRAAERAYKAAVELDAGYTRALANQERVVSIEGSQATDNVDLTELAQQAVKMIETWDRVSW